MSEAHPDAQPAAQPAAVPPADAPTLPCPYCGQLQSADAPRCSSCGGLFDPLSRQASQNAMGPWWIRDEARPFQPGCSYETLRRLVARGKVGAETVIRGPTTRQFWMLAQDAPGVSHLLGRCYACHGPAGPEEYMCRRCGAVFEAPQDRQRLGLAPIRLLPGEASPEKVAASTLAQSSGQWTAIEEPASDELRQAEAISATAAVQAVRLAVGQSARQVSEEARHVLEQEAQRWRAEAAAARQRSARLLWLTVTLALLAVALGGALVGLVVG